MENIVKPEIFEVCFIDTLGVPVEFMKEKI